MILFDCLSFTYIFINFLHSFHKSSQAEVSMNMDYDYRPGYVDTNATITVRGTEVRNWLLVRHLEAS